MNNIRQYSRNLAWSAAVLLSALVAGCGGGGSDSQDPILGGGGTPELAPRVTAVAPANNATSVPINNTVITAAFSKPMNPATINTSTFTLTCPGTTAVAGTVSYVAASRTATFTPAAPLPASSTCTATITTGATDTSGLRLVSNFVWTFSTGLAPDLTRPRVTLTVPATTTPGPTANVPTNTGISALLSEEMAPATINTTSFTVSCTAPCVNPTGTVTYSVGSRTAVFLPTAPLAAGVTYTATITTAATDLAGNALAGNQAALPAASNYIWTFTTSAPVPAGVVGILSTNPANNATNVCPNATISVTFSPPGAPRMNPMTINAGTFSLTGPGTTVVTAGSVVLNGSDGITATFTPLAPLTTGVTYTITITGGAGGVQDLSIPPSTMPADRTFTFSVGPATGACLPQQTLGLAAPFGIFGGSAGMTNQGVLTVINGDNGTTATNTSAVTGFHDLGGDIYTETGSNQGAVNGRIYTCTVSTTGPTSAAVNPASCTIATQARAAALATYNALVALPAGLDPGAGSLAGRTLTPGVYTAALGSFSIIGGNLTLDAQGNANAVFVFQMATSLTVGGPGAAFPQSVLLINGAQAKNVFWQVGSAATINAGGGGTMVGTIISQAGVAVSTAGNTTLSIINGRALSLGAAVTVVNTVINVPAQ